MSLRQQGESTTEDTTAWWCPVCLYNAFGPTCRKCGGPADVLVGMCELGPCAREGREGTSDWWKSRHASCTGSHHLGAGEIMLCSCPCHVTPGQWFKIGHFIFGEPVE